MIMPNKNFVRLYVLELSPYVTNGKTERMDKHAHDMQRVMRPPVGRHHYIISWRVLEARIRSTNCYSTLQYLRNASATQTETRNKRPLEIMYRVARKNGIIFMYTLTRIPNINRFSQLFHCQKLRIRRKIVMILSLEDPTTPQLCRYTTLWNVKCLKSNSWKQDDVRSCSVPLS